MYLTLLWKVSYNRTFQLHFSLTDPIPLYFMYVCVQYVGRRYQFECGRASQCVMMKELFNCGRLSSYTSLLFSSCRYKDRIGYILPLHGEHCYYFCWYWNKAVFNIVLSSKIRILNFQMLEIQSENLYNQRQKAAHVS